MSTQQPSSPTGAALFGQLIGNYRLVRLLGEGGMGMVYEAVHVTAGGQAAIKILRPEVAGRHDITARFFNEARAANSISHPSIVRVFDCGYATNGLAFLAMEFLAGETLRERLERGQRLTTGESLRIARQIASALHAAHQRQVIHRDIKPDNIMLVPDPDLLSGERVKVLDFGISKIADSLGAEPVNTRSDLLMGTPTYMAPEQCRGAKHVTDKSDVYSLGIILYQMLAGTPPFVGESVGELIAMHLTDEPPPLTKVAPQVGPQVATLVHAMLEKKIPARPNMEETLRELLRFVNALASFPTVRPSGEIAIPTIKAASLSDSERLVPASGDGASPLRVAQPSTISGNPQPGSPALPAGLDHALGTWLPISDPPTQPLVLAKLSHFLPSQAPTEKRPAIVAMHQAGNPSGVRHASSDGKTLAGTASELRRRIGIDQRLWNGLAGFVGLGLFVAIVAWQINRHNSHIVHAVSKVIVNAHEDEEKLSQPPMRQEPAPITVRPAEPTVPKRDVTSPTITKPDTPSPVTPSPPPSKEDIVAEQARNQAITAFKNQKYQEAQQWATSCIGLRPKNSKCWWILGRAACRHDKFIVISKSIEKLDFLGRIDLVDEIVAECLDAGLRRDNNGIFFRPDPRNPFTPPGLRVAFELAAKGSCDDSIRMAKTYIDTQPQDAWYTIGKCGCSTKNSITANLALDKLKISPSIKSALINACIPMGFNYIQGQLQYKK